MLPDLAAPRQQSSTTPEYPTSKDQQQFFTTLKALMPKSAILSSLQPNPSCSAAPAPAIHRLPTTLMSLRHPKYRTMSKEDINLECHRIINEEIKITQEEADYLEKSTKLQAQSLLWFAHRRGRITASKFSAVLHTSIASPSQSLVDSILAEKCFEAKSPSLEWGRVNEPVAREEYLHIMQRTHTKFKVQAAGLFINPLYPHLGASPDGLVSCLCCGAGVIEIKCPYSIRNSDPSTAAETSHFYLEHGAEGSEYLTLVLTLCLKHDHPRSIVVTAGVALKMEEFKEELRAVEKYLIYGEYEEGMEKGEKANFRRKCRNNYKLEDGVLHYRKNITCEGKDDALWRVCVRSDEEKERILESCHAGVAVSSHHYWEECSSLNQLLIMQYKFITLKAIGWQQQYWSQTRRSAVDGQFGIITK
eukprot:Em0001g3205a